MKRPKSGLFGLIVPRNNIKFGGAFPLSRSQTNKCLTTDFFFFNTIDVKWSQIAVLHSIKCSEDHIIQLLSERHTEI